MSKLTELSSSKHQQLKFAPGAEIAYGSKLHMLNIRVTEVPKMVANFPVFISKIDQSGDWSLSGVTSFVPGQNLFVENQKWDALYQPTSVRVYPLYLMKSPNTENSYTTGIVEGSEGFTEDQGAALFDDKGNPSLELSEKQKLLEGSVKEDIQTYHFCQKLNELGLIKAVDLVLMFEELGPQVLKGLHTIDEEALQRLSAQQLEELNKMGYLGPIHGILMSIFQINQLVNRNNTRQGLEKINQVKLELSRDRSGAL